MYISGNATMKPPANRAKGTFRFVFCLAGGYIDTLLSFSQLASSYSFVHDTTLELHTFKYTLVPRRVMSLVGINRCTLRKFGFC